MARAQAWETGVMYEGQNAILKARVTTDAGTRITSTVAGTGQECTELYCWVYDVTRAPATLQNAIYDLNDGATPPPAGHPIIADFITTDGQGYLTTGWNLDLQGYNLCIVIPDGDGTGFTVPWQGGHSYRIEVKVVTEATLTPGGDEGPVTFVAYLDVESMLGTT